MNKRLLALRLLPMLILAIAVGSFMFLKYTAGERVKPVPREKIWQVDTMTAQKQTLAPTLTLFGKVETQQLVRAAAPGTGLVAQVLVKPGDRVVTGQRLVIMDRRDFAAANLQAEADVADIEAQLAEHDLRYKSNLKSVEEEQRLLELARKEVKRIESLKARNLSSESALSDAREVLGRQELALIAKQLEVDRYQTTRKQLRARLSRARARVAETELAIERSEVIAAFDGVVADVQVAGGDQVRAADVLVSLYPLDSLEIRARLPAGYQAEIQQALERGLKLEALADGKSKPLRLALARLAGEADPSGIDAFFHVTDDSSGLRIGNLVSLQLSRPPQDDVVAVPFRAIYGNNRVFLHRDGRMVSVDVESVGQLEIGAGKSSLLIRSAAINDGDNIITTHLPNAVDGLKVRTGPPPKKDEGEKMSARRDATQE